MSEEKWDWSFACFADPPAPETHRSAASRALSDEEPRGAGSYAGPGPAESELERHLWSLRMARTPEERRRAASAALRFLEQTRSRRVVVRASGRAMEERPTVVDKSHPRPLGPARISSGGDAAA